MNTEAKTSRDFIRRALASMTLKKDVYDDDSAVELAPFQRRAVRQIVRITRIFGGALLADAVGLGKTRVCLAAASVLARDRRRLGQYDPIWCCVPARLKPAWEAASHRFGFTVDTNLLLASHTDLSRGKTPDRAPSLIIVDEAHRFRNPRAKRSRELARWASITPTLLATATPVSNSIRDLHHLLAFFLADHDLRRLIGQDLETAFQRAEAGDYDLTELVSRVCVRREAVSESAGFGRRPTAKLRVVGYDPDVDERWIWQRLEPELAALHLDLLRDDWPRGLFVEHVLRRWESGPEALLQTLESMTEFHRRWLEASRQGRSLSRAEFRSLFQNTNIRQNVFSFMYQRSDRGAADSDRAEADFERLQAMASRVRRVVTRSSGRDRVIVDLVHGSNDKLLVFTGYQRAARGIFDHLCRELGSSARIGLVTGSGCRVTGLGRARADEVIARFAPRANGAGELDRHQQLQVLVATDCLSEGVNLQDCGRIVLADLPYSPLGIEQRVGRLVRPGGPHDTVHVYLPRPSDWNDSLGMRRRLDDKIGHVRMAGARSSIRSLRGSSSPREDDPLAALTRLDALAARIEAGSAAPFDDQLHLHASTKRTGPGLWVVARIQDDDFSRTEIVRFTQDGVETRLCSLLPAIIELVDADIPLVRGSLNGGDLRRVNAWRVDRENFLNATRLAPLPLDWDAPQVRLWKLIQDWMDDGRFVEQHFDRDELRRLLLRPMTRGLTATLGHFVDHAPSPREFIRLLDRLPEMKPRKPVRVKIVATLLT